MTEFQPTPQTPEEVAEGLRNAMKQAKEDGVFDLEKFNNRPPSLWNVMRHQLGFSIDMCDEIVDAVEQWLPEQQSAAGSQNVNTELLVEGFNDCLDKMKVMLR